jgi:sulfur carrier protein
LIEALKFEMKLTVNGKETGLDRSLLVKGLLVDQAVKMPEMVSVELNGRILRRSEFDTTALNDGDTVEFLYFMGGGRATHRTTD